MWLLKGWIFPEKLKPILDAVKPEDVAVFYGKLQSAELSGFEQWICKKVKAEIGDFRDWQLIAS